MVNIGKYSIRLMSEGSLRVNKTPINQIGKEGSTPLPSHQQTFYDYVEIKHKPTKPYLQLVETGKQRDIFNKIIKAHHSYVATTHYGGRRINWLVRSKDTRKILGIIGIGSAIMAMRARDRWIGWVPKQRVKHLVNIANNWRYCLLPDAPKNFGSQVLSLLCKLAPKEWEKKYNNKLVLLETLVERPHTGIVYKASNWRLIGLTKGTAYKWIKKDKYPKYKKAGWSVVQKFCKYGDKTDFNRWQIVEEFAKKRKLIFVKPLVPNFAKILRARVPV